MTEERPLLVALEGIDNAGKTTLCDVLATDLRSKVVLSITKELTSAIGQAIRKGLKQECLSSLDKVLLFAADRQLRLTEMMRADPRPRVILADRWVHSAIAYRRAEDEALSDYVKDVNQIFPAPDLTILVDITASESLSRGAPIEKNTYEEAYLSRVRDEYLKLVQEGKLVLVDGMRSRTKVLADVRARVLTTLRARGFELADESSP